MGRQTPCVRPSTAPLAAGAYRSFYATRLTSRPLAIVASPKPAPLMTDSASVAATQPVDEVRWYFQAMEYFALILNRTYTVMVTDRMLCGAYVRGPIPSPPFASREWHDPDFYVGQRVYRYAGLHVESREFR